MHTPADCIETTAMVITILAKIKVEMMVMVPALRTRKSIARMRQNCDEQFPVLG